MAFLVALQFLTIFPVRLRREATSEELGRSLGWFPAVGLLLGLILASLDRLMGLVFPPALLNALLLVALVVMTGAIHLDGFMDTCDGLAGSSPEERLRIMRDSRVGAFGVAGMGCLLLIKYFSLASLPAALRLAALILMPVLGRWVIVYAVFAYPYGREGLGVGKIFKDQADWKGMLLATLTSLVLSLALLQLGGLVVMIGLLLFVVLVAAFLLSRIPGLTGDAYGAVNELAEAMVLILIPLVMGGYALLD